MKLNTKNKIQTIIDGYKANCASQGAEIEKILEPFKVPGYANRFTQEGLRQTIKEQMDVVLADWKKYDTTLNQQVAAIIAAAKKDIMKALNVPKVNRPADYAIKIANAREFLKMELDGQDATNPSHSDMKDFDAALFLILKDFVDDYDTMKLFAKMVESKFMIYDAMTGECGLPKTFGKMMKMEGIMNTVNEMESISVMLFLSTRTDFKEVIRINGSVYGVPVDGYGQNVDLENIINNATILDGLADEIDSEGQSETAGSGQKVDLEGGEE